MDLESSSGLSLLSSDRFVFEGKGRDRDLQAAAEGPARVRHPAETFPSLLSPAQVPREFSRHLPLIHLSLRPIILKLADELGQDELAGHSIFA